MIPLHKREDKTLAKNYRPVSLLCVSGMVCERIIAIQIEDFFEENVLFGDFQFGFRKNKSTTSELLTLFDNLMEAKEKSRKLHWCYMTLVQLLTLWIQRYS